MAEARLDEKRTIANFLATAFHSGFDEIHPQIVFVPSTYDDKRLM
jgi:hypothetical protein